MTRAALQRVLYVDDEVDIQEVAAMAIELSGDIKVVTCGSGKEALLRAIEFRPDLILLDVMMPEMDGPTTLAALQRSPDLAMIPVVFITAKAQPAEIQRYRQLGAADVIAKPFDPMALGDRVQSIWAKLRD